MLVSTGTAFCFGPVTPGSSQVVAKAYKNDHYDPAGAGRYGAPSMQ
ncbi:hypothetical protein FAES_5369 [Fibrella aestuarina BUZ 2]|uniref:Uncharacterized protein n=1 Tax=Fibrella aestuarina BUZ 2 TaxID=1166018 RepID=I0KGW5_9BACT|nr:hypothetical protein FAES_5369 [Fibrella aestuarina BUZ 2]